MVELLSWAELDNSEFYNSKLEKMKRRSFLRHSTHGLAVPALLGSFGFSPYRNLSSLLKLSEETDKVLVLIFLQGGNDGLNTLIPLSQLSALNKVRPHVILPENKLLKLSDSGLALHPSLKGLQELYTQGRLRPIQSVGYPEQNYSHFRSTDIWMSGSDSDQLVNSGWAGRQLAQEHPEFPEDYPNDVFTDPLSIEIGYGSSLIFQGPKAPMNMVINDPSYFYELVDGVEGPLPEGLAGEKLRHIRLTARQSQLYGEVVKKAALYGRNQADYPSNNPLADQLKIVARLIAGGLKTPLYLVNLSGFDTHDAQVASYDHTQGEHANLLRQLDEGIMSFLKDLELQKADDRVLGMTFSEFGRRIVSNASLGTDHGSAAPMFVFGNEVIPGALGYDPIISQYSTYEDNLSMQFDFRAVYASILEQWFGKSAVDRHQILFKDFITLPILRDEVVSTKDHFRESAPAIRVFPNPVQANSILEVEASGDPMRIDLIDLQGRMVKPLFSGILPKGKQQINWPVGRLPVGNYVVRLQQAGRNQSVQVMKVQ